MIMNSQLPPLISLRDVRILKFTRLGLNFILRWQGQHIIGPVLHVASLNVKCEMLCVTVIPR